MENILFYNFRLCFQLNTVQVMFNDSITYTSFEAIWGESVGNSALFLSQDSLTSPF